MNYRAVKGMNDILPDEMVRWHHLEREFRVVAERHGYGEVRTPIIESTALFTRSIGEATDIVEKEMYSFERHGEALTVRPEGTASAVRAYVEHHIHQKEPVTRWYYLGPMFRGERPARGRYRQFHQLGCELFGDAGSVCDAEMIDMLHGLFMRLGISDLEIDINSLGGADTRPRYRQIIVDHLEPRKARLSEDSIRRLSSNPLRILDSKDERDIAALEGLPSIIEVLTQDDREHFDRLCSQLDRLGTPYRVDPTLVRGLDYYTRTLFELRSQAGQVGAQNALGGGGRYDNLVQQMGGPSTPAIGFALGVERILLAMDVAELASPPLVVIAPIGPQAASEALLMARELRDHGICVELDGRGGASTSLKAMLRRANARGARVCLVLGQEELESQKVQLKDLAARSQVLVAREELMHRLLDVLQQPMMTGGAA